MGSCVSEEEFSNSPQGNFDALWQIVDEHYCFFPDKAAEYGLDWNECRSRYGAMLLPKMTGEQLFEVFKFIGVELDEIEFNPNLVQNPVYKSSSKY